jgi:predicted transposase YbfD/YdcC
MLMNEKEAKIGFLDHFKGLEDPRIERCKLHPMEEILLLVLCGVIAGCDGWEDIEDFGKAKLDFLRQYLPYKQGVPSDDTLRRFFRALAPKLFTERFMEWVKSLQETTLAARVIALDGKTSRHSFDGAGKALHLVSAFASEARLVLGQVAVDSKTNEITAIPELLKWLDVRGAIVTIDAMGCQVDIAAQIQEQGGDYVFSLKGNQGTLSEDVRTFFEKPPQHSVLPCHKTVDAEHGRIETRICSISTDIAWLQERHPHWAGLNSIVKIESTREKGEKIEKENRYYISSLDTTPAHMLAAIRSHWAIENTLHWVLDMSFGDDQCRIRKDNAPANMAIIRHCALNMIQQTKTKRQSVKRMRKKAGWDNNTLETILRQNL